MPVSDPATELTFVADNATILDNGLENVNNDNIPGAFSLNILDLQGTGPSVAGGWASVTITALGAGSLNLASNAAAGPVVNLNAHHGNSSLMYDVRISINLAEDTTFQGDGTAVFQFGAIHGNGGLIKHGAGALVLLGSNDYTGGTTIEGGTLQLGNGVNTAGSVAGDIVNNASLVFASPYAQTFSGVITGTGNVTKTGGDADAHRRQRLPRRDEDQRRHAAAFRRRQSPARRHGRRHGGRRRRAPGPERSEPDGGLAWRWRNDLSAVRHADHRGREGRGL